MGPVPVVAQDHRLNSLSLFGRCRSKKAQITAGPFGSLGDRPTIAMAPVWPRDVSKDEGKTWQVQGENHVNRHQE
jgi:hypothetical protein